jgi:tetratricopeptide (TPR) repeat protein
MFDTHRDLETFSVFINRETMGLIITLFNDQECVNTIVDIDTQEWVCLCIKEPAQVFVPVGCEVAREWLIYSWDSTTCMIFVLSIYLLLHGADIWDSTSPPSVGTVLEVARWAGYEENAYWHYRVGVGLNTFGHYDAAIEHLNTALALEPIWEAKLELAEVYEEQGRLDDALRLLRQCEADFSPQATIASGNIEPHDLESKNPRELAPLRAKIGLLHLQLGDHPSAMKSFMESNQLNKSLEVRAAVSLIRLLFASESPQYGIIIQMIDLNCLRFNLFFVVCMYFSRWDWWDNSELPLILAVCAKRCKELQLLEFVYRAWMKHYSEGVAGSPI